MSGRKFKAASRRRWTFQQREREGRTSEQEHAVDDVERDGREERGSRLAKAQEQWRRRTRRRQSPTRHERERRSLARVLDRSCGTVVRVVGGRARRMSRRWRDPSRAGNGGRCEWTLRLAAGRARGRDGHRAAPRGAVPRLWGCDARALLRTPRPRGPTAPAPATTRTGCRASACAVRPASGWSATTWR